MRSDGLDSIGYFVPKPNLSIPSTELVWLGLDRLHSIQTNTIQNRLRRSTHDLLIQDSIGYLE
jgi:hypothetical protein